MSCSVKSALTQAGYSTSMCLKSHGKLPLCFWRMLEKGSVCLILCVCTSVRYSKENKSTKGDV